MWTPKSILHTSFDRSFCVSFASGVKCAAQLFIDIPVGNAIPLFKGNCLSKLVLINGEWEEDLELN